MSLKEYAVKEFIRSPIMVTTTVLGVFGSICGFVYSSFQPAAIQGTASPSATSVAAYGLHLPNLILVISFFLASSLSAASLIRILHRSFPFHAMVLSVLAAVLTGFLSLLVFQLAPPRPFMEQTLAHAKDVVFWATLFIYLAINGRAAIDGVAEAGAPSKRSDDADGGTADVKEASGALFFLVVQLLIWGGLVSAGLSKLVQLFLQ